MKKNLSENSNETKKDIPYLMSTISYPKTPAKRYAELNGLAMKLIDCAKLDSTIFKQTKLQLNQMILNAQQQLDKGETNKKKLRKIVNCLKKKNKLLLWRHYVKKGQDSG